MKIALVCDDLIQFGGQERLVMAISEIWPDAPLYTSYASTKWKGICKDRGINLKVSFMQKLPFIEKLYRYYFIGLFHIIAFERFDFSKYDVVLSISSRYAHHIRTKPTTKHICYMNSPGRMFWETSDYFNEETYGILKPIRALARPVLKWPLWLIRQLDYAAAQRVDRFIANAKLPKQRIKKYYRRNSEIIYPFVDLDQFKDVKPQKEHSGDYFVVTTRLAPWKRVDIAIQACFKSNTKLKVIGEGPDLERLKSMAGPTIEFLGYLSDEDKIKTLSGCKAFIQTQKEDFGIAALEALACGRPVLAFGEGGALETITEKTGEFFNEQTAVDLERVIKDFDEKQFSPTDCMQQAEKFSKWLFQEQIESVTDGIL